MKSLLGPMRLPFLALTPACVMIGVGTAYWQVHYIAWFDVLLILIGAIASHISVNTFNEHFDFKSGLDEKTVRTQFSGGSGTLPNNPALAKSTLLFSVISLMIAATIGLYFIMTRGWGLLPLGVFGLVLLVTYTTWWAYHPFACLIAPGLGFGILMVMGTHFSLTGTYSWSSFVASLVPTLLVSDLLLLNQFPDVEADKSIGRKHFPISIGRTASAYLYGLLLAKAYAVLFVGILLGWLPAYCTLAGLTMPLAWKTFKGVRQNAENIPSLLPFMGMNVIINIVTPLLLAFGFFMA